MSDAMERLRARQQGKFHDGGVLDSIMQPRPISQDDIIQIPGGKLHGFSAHTFLLRPSDDPYMLSLAESIRDNGILEPLLVRPHPTIFGAYEIVAGHTRHHLGTQVGLTTFPCIVRSMDDADAVIQMGESNLQRPGWLPSEKARTYKAHLEAIRQKRRRVQPSCTHEGFEHEVQPSCTFEAGEKSRDLAAKRWGITGQALEMYIKLTDLHPTLLQMVDEGRIPVKAGFQLAFLPEGDQEALYTLLAGHPTVKVNEALAKELRCTAREGFPRVLGLESVGIAKRPTWSVALPRDMLGADAKRYLADSELQGRIIAVVRDYVAERKGGVYR